MAEKFKLKSSIKYPTSLIIRGNDFIGVEIAKSLIEQGGYVIVIDSDVEKTMETYKSIADKKLLSIIDFTSIDYLDEDLRRLDYVFFLGHNFDSLNVEISSQEFLQASNYLDAIIKLARKFESKFLLTSSIKAHQLLMLNSEIDVNFGAKSMKKHTIYTQAEIQRYSEALVMESIDKLELDARVVRLGHVIGKGMEFDLTNSFDQLVFQAVQGEDLKVDKDGLETNLFVHVLDAAYGLIKAMFTKGTKGKIFSVSNEEEVTDLSIAYKLQELLGLAVEIKFVDSKDQIPPVRFYKPALSLTTIGWAPRVPFIRAISQAVDYAIELYNKNAKKQQEEGSKDRDEQDIAMDENFEDAEPKGALARLIAERKKQEKSRRGSILMAHEKVQLKNKPRRELTRSEKVMRRIRIFYDRIAYKLTFLKKITISEAIFYLVCLILFSILYIQVISPLFVIGRNILTIEYYRPKFVESMKDSDYQAAYTYSSKLDKSITSLHTNFSKLQPEASLIGRGDSFANIDSDIRNIELYNHELTSSLHILSDFDKYWASLDSGIKYVPNANSTLVVSGTSEDSAYRQKVESYQNQIAQSVNKLDTTSKQVNANGNITVLSYDTSKLLADLNSGKQGIVSSLNYAKNYIGLIMNEDQDRTYAFVLQDNSKYTPAGGYPSGVGFIKVQDGKVSQLYLAPINSGNDKVLTDITDNEFNEIQLASPSLVTKNSITFSQLFLVERKEVIADNVINYYKDNLGIEPDLVFFMNLDTLANILGEKGSIELNQVDITKTSLLSSINLLQSSDKSSDKRNQIITNIFAAKFANLVNSDSDIYSILPKLYEAAKNKSVWVSGEDADAIEVLLGQNVEKELPADWMQIELVSDPKTSEVNIFPSITVNVKDTINKDFTITRAVEINQSNLENLENVIVCMSIGAKDFNLSGSPVALGQGFVSNKTCVSGQPGSSAKAISFSYIITKGVENLGQDKYNRALGFKSTSGLDVHYEYEADFDVSFKIDSDTDLAISEQKAYTTSNLADDQVINIKFSK